MPIYLHKCLCMHVYMHARMHKSRHRHSKLSTNLNMQAKEENYDNNNIDDDEFK